MYCVCTCKADWAGEGLRDCCRQGCDLRKVVMKTICRSERGERVSEWKWNGGSEQPGEERERERETPGLQEWVNLLPTLHYHWMTTEGCNRHMSLKEFNGYTHTLTLTYHLVCSTLYIQCVCTVQYSMQSFLKKKIKSLREQSEGVCTWTGVIHEVTQKHFSH